MAQMPETPTVKQEPKVCAIIEEDDATKKADNKQNVPQLKFTTSLSSRRITDYSLPESVKPPGINTKNIYPIFGCTGVLFLIIGLIIFIASLDKKIKEVDYTNCKSLHSPNQTCIEALKVVNDQACWCLVEFDLDEMSSNVYFYYQIKKMFQSHRFYFESKDRRQLNGLGKSRKGRSKISCDRYINFENETAPCGAMANSLFNDSFSLQLLSNKTGGWVAVSWNEKDITFGEEIDYMFR